MWEHLKDYSWVGGGINCLTKAASQNRCKNKANQNYVNSTCSCIPKGTSWNSISVSGGARNTKMRKTQIPDPLLKVARSLRKAARMPPPPPYRGMTLNHHCRWQDHFENIWNRCRVHDRTCRGPHQLACCCYQFCAWVSFFSLLGCFRIFHKMPKKYTLQRDKDKGHIFLLPAAPRVRSSIQSGGRVWLVVFTPTKKYQAEGLIHSSKTCALITPT